MSYVILTEKHPNARVIIFISLVAFFTLQTCTAADIHSVGDCVHHNQDKSSKNNATTTFFDAVCRGY